MRLLLVLLLAVSITAASDNRTYDSRDGARSKGTTPNARSVGGHRRNTSKRCTSCTRDANGRIKRNPAARRAFMQQHPCPATGRTTGACPGYVVDHVVPLKRGGADTPDNMQWQKTLDAKAKDKVE
jgi:5-methylcytosine-specific restriction endonuclease McrA